MKAVKCVVLDFDGTLTKPISEGAIFEGLYRARLAAATKPSVLDHWSMANAQVEANPERHGLVIGKEIAAPGDADPYVRCFTVTQLLDQQIGLAPSYDALQKVAVACYAAAYGEITDRHWSAAMFRDNAADFLQYWASAQIPVWIVSNADVTQVERRLSVLSGDFPPPVLLGQAQKHWLGPAPKPDARFDEVPEVQVLAGLARPLKLRRGLYFEALRKIWEATRVSVEQTLVVGDIYEMDLALPATLGAQVHLIQNGALRAPYRNALLALEGRGGLSADFSAVIARHGLAATPLKSKGSIRG